MSVDMRRLNIAMADNDAFDGRSRLERPLGGAQSGFCELADALAAEGHNVTAFTGSDRRYVEAGITWRHLDDPKPHDVDLYIANRGSKLIGLFPQARHRVFWLRNPARHLNKLKFMKPLLRWRPTLVVTGAYHAATVPRWIPRSYIQVIPHGTNEVFWRPEALERAPAKRAIFFSNPERSLEWLADLWTSRIAPAVPDAELRIFSGAATYGGYHAQRMNDIVSRVRERADASVKISEPISRDRLLTELATSRLFPYRGDPGETFCQAAAEAQSMGIPVVTQPIGSLPERVLDRKTGVVAKDDEEFASWCVELLSNDELWMDYHRAALERPCVYSWREAARRFVSIAVST